MVVTVMASPDQAPQSQERRRQTLVESLRHRYAAAQSRQDPAAKQGLFKEAVYLNILPGEFTDPA